MRSPLSCRLGSREVGPLDEERICRVIESVLTSYHCQHTHDICTGDGLSLVDVLTPPGQKTIDLGKKELAGLVDAVCGAVLDVLRQERIAEPLSGWPQNP